MLSRKGEIALATHSRAAERIEELTLNAWPALRHVHVDGWLVRLSEGYTKRSNSVQALREIPDPSDIQDRIAACERVYAEAGLPTIFKLTPFSRPASLDSVLEQLGYAVVEPSHVLVRSLARLPPSSWPGEATGRSAATDEWLEHVAAWNSYSDKNLATARKLLAEPYPSKRFFALYRGGEAVACGMGAVERGYVGLYDIVTNPDCRNQGVGEQLLLHILNWARTSGAHSAYLQVVRKNAPANRLYAKLGFEPLYSYWYRVQT
ncbi:GNAT family N-acetyltransferase [Cohnella xylanilytica]|uniref:GNAT family N-acetyltransferase n=1 Tax=Cohnella xylanilytica TaxID=557555 RepID=UPI00406417DE